MSDELSRSFRFLKENADPAPDFLSYEVTEIDSQSISASWGYVATEKSEKKRWLDVAVHLGSPTLDNDRQAPGGRALSFEDVPAAIKRTLWLETDRVYRAAAELWRRTQAGGSAHGGDGGVSQYPSVRRKAPLPPPAFDFDYWKKAATEISARFREYPRILTSRVDVTADQDTRYLVNSEGTRLIHGRGFLTLRISASSRTANGEEVRAFASFAAQDTEGVPKKDNIIAAADRVADDLIGLLDAPAAEPFAGPAIFSGRAAGAIFHELLGRRLEGRRRQTAGEAPPFAANTKVLPDFLSATFDPNRRRAAGVDLNGWYEYDDEGVKARRVVAVEHGVVRSLVLARSTVDDPNKSNGHGRKQPGREVAARESNLMVESASAVPETKLREMLTAEVKRQHKPYGLYFQDVAAAGGGLDARIVYRVYPDGRPDELIRGVELASIPAAILMSILATGDKPEALNLHSDGESGSIPVSVVAPSILLPEIDITRKPSVNGPPLLPPLLPPPPPLFQIPDRK